jgi:integrase
MKRDDWTLGTRGPWKVEDVQAWMRRTFGDGTKAAPADRQAAARLRRWFEEIVGGGDERPATIAEFAGRFMDYANATYAERVGNSEALNCRYALRGVVELYGDQPIASFGRVQLEASREYMASLGWCRTTINAQVNRVRRVWRWGATRGWVPAERLAELGAVAPLRRGRCEAPEPDAVGPVDATIVRRTLPHLPRPVAAMVELMLYSAMRVGEAIIMRGEDLHVRDRGPLLKLADTSSSAGYWFYVPRMHKTAWRGHGRTVFLGPRCREIVRKWLRPGHMFLGPRGEPYTTSGINQAIRRACRSAGVEHWSPHQLRHTAATEARKRGGLEAAQLLLGHRSAGITELYAERDLGRGFQLAEEIG